MMELLNKLDGSNNNVVDEKKLSLAQMGSIKESEYSNSISKTNLTLDSLMEGIQDTQGFRDLQKTLSKQQAATPAPLDKVVADRLQRKMAYVAQSKDLSRWVKVIQENRQAETLDFKPKDRLDVTRDTLVDKFEPKTDFEKEIEQALEEAGQQDEEAVLKAEEDALQDDLGANRLTMEEYKKRRGQLAQIRALMFYHEQKRHHMKKIKSKKYRKIRKKQRERLKGSALEAAMEDDEELAKELKEKEEVARIQERMTLAHKNTSKWAKRILKRGKNVDTDTRRALSAQLKRGDDLRKKMMGEKDDDSASDDSDGEDLVESARKVLEDTEDASDPTHGKTGLFKLSFMQKGIQKQREQAREEARKLLSELQANEMDDYDNVMNDNNDEDETPQKKVKVASDKEMKDVLEHGELVATSLEFGNSNAISTSGEIEIDLGDGNLDSNNADGVPDSSNKATDSGPSEFVSTLVVNKGKEMASRSTEDNGASKKNKRKAKDDATQSNLKSKVDVDEEEANPWMKMAVTTSNKSSSAKKGVVDVAGAVNILDAGKSEKTENLTKSHSESKDNSEAVENKMITSLTQEELVRKAFVGQSDKEIDEDFQKEKEAMTAENDPTRKVEKERNSGEVSGWGSWTGQGALPPKPRKLPNKLQPPKKKKEEKRKRLDDAKPGVIINQKRLKKTANTFMLGDVPHPYATRAEYEQAMLGGVGKEWNVSSSFKNTTRPEILTRAGKIIQPISKKVKAPRPAAKF
jgi:U3 small nucleolar RNA-associated protein 14